MKMPQMLLEETSENSENVKKDRMKSTQGFILSPSPFFFILLTFVFALSMIFMANASPVSTFSQRCRGLEKEEKKDMKVKTSANKSSGNSEQILLKDNK